MKNNFFLNPFSLYGLSFGLVLLLYGLEWSDVYPKLSAQLLWFIVTTVALMFFFSYTFYRKNYFEYKKIKPPEKRLGTQILFCYLLLIVEFVHAQSIPLLSMISGSGSDYSEFGLPFIHVFFAAYVGFLSVYVFHCLISKEKGQRKRLLLYLLLLTLPGILIVNRAMIMSTFIGWGIVYMMSVKKLGKIIIKLVVVALLIFYLFGLMGNYRTSGNGDSQAIMAIGKANDDFKNNLVPGEFFWIYIYMASPMGNLQYNINKSGGERLDQEDGLKKLIVIEFMPEMISKRISPIMDIKRGHIWLVIDHLNAYTMYSAAYTYGGWAGMWFMFGFMLFFVFTNLLLIPKTSPYFITGMAIISTLLMLNIFNNFFSFMNIISQIFVVNLLSFPYLIAEIKNHRKKKSLTS